VRSIRVRAPRSPDRRVAGAFITDAYFSRQPVAKDGNGFGLFSALPPPSDLPLIATSCNHGAP